MKTAINKVSARLLGGVVVLAAFPALADSDIVFPPFDLGALIWMLVGAAVAGLICMIQDSISRAGRMSPPRVVSIPTPGSQPENGMGEPNTQGGGQEPHPMEYWTNLEEATTVTVGELSRVEEEAEVFVMTGRPDVAIKVLRDYLNFEADCRISVWFKLLDIYHSQGMRGEFKKLAHEIRKRFNVALPTWEDSRARMESRHGLEHFPHLLDKIAQHWNDPAGLADLQELMRDNRHGKRTGFHEEAFREMLLLYEVLEIKMGRREEQA